MGTEIRFDNMATASLRNRCKRPEAGQDGAPMLSDWDILRQLEEKAKEVDRLQRRLERLQCELEESRIEKDRFRHKAALVDRARLRTPSWDMQYSTIQISGLFDAAFYLERNPRLRREKLDPIAHYLTHGVLEGLDPHPLFDTAYYLAHHPDLDPLLLNPLVHFLLYGMQEQSAPNPFFDVQYYLQACPEAASSGLDLLRHYLLHGAALGIDPHPQFSGAFYLRENRDVARAGINPLVHFLANGRAEGRLPHPVFLAENYFANHPQAQAAMERLGLRNTFEHWLATGAAPEVSAAQPDPIDDDIPESEAAVRATFNELAYLFHNQDVAGAVADGSIPSGLDHWLRHGWREGRKAGGVAPYAGRQTNLDALASRPVGVDFFGLFQEPSGLGECARQCLGALSVSGVAARGHTVRYDRPAGRFIAALTPPPRFRINVFNLNADMFPMFFKDRTARRLLDDRYNIGIWFWELCSFRPDWMDSFGALDELWAASNFIRDTLALSTSLPVTTIPIPVEPNVSLVDYDRAHFDIPEDVFVFAHIFDVGSQLERKNPFGLVEAYKKAFGNRQDVMLILKYHSSYHDNENVARLMAMSQGANIKHIPWIFTNDESVSFKKAIDCFVSPHRSEGFGLNIAESMYFGKPVIATAYSANMDFMDTSNSYPLDYRLSTITAPAGPYLPGYLWADPDQDHLIDLMRHVAERPAEAAQKAQRAAQRIRSKLSRAAVGARMRGRIEELGLDGCSSQWLDTALFRHHWGSSRQAAWQSAFVGSWSREDLAVLQALPATPVISMIVPVYNINQEYLEKCIESVLGQSYPFFELCLYDDASTLPETLETLERYRYHDQRIKIRRGERNLGISGASNAAVALSSGEFIALLDNDDELHPDALLRVVQTLASRPDTDFFYTDEDKIEVDGSHVEDYCKPDFSPEHLMSCMYILHMMVIRKSLFLTLGGFRDDYAGAQDYDLALRLSLATDKIVHVPNILYHWRKIPGSAAAVVDAKPTALENARRAVEDHARVRFGPDTTVTQGKLPGLFRVRPSLAGRPPVTLVITTNNKVAEVAGRGTINLLDNFLASILEKTEYPNYRVLVVDNGNVTEAQRAAYAALPVDIVSYPFNGGPFNFAHKANFAFRQVPTNHLVLLNDDMEIIDADWLRALLEFSTQPDIGAVGAKLLYLDGRIQHCGILLGVNGSVAHAYHGSPWDTVGYNGFVQIIRNYGAVTGACMATRKDVLERTGGFDEALAIDFNDIDFCLKALASGLRNVYTPFCELYHFESATAVRSAQNPAEVALFCSRWQWLLENDPYHNPNLSKSHIDFRLRERPAAG